MAHYSPQAMGEVVGRELGRIEREVDSSRRRRTKEKEEL